MKPIVVIGSVNVDLVALVERIPATGETLTSRTFDVHHGGKGANQAVAVARLGYPVSMIAKVGSDNFGRELTDALKSCGVDVTAVTIAEGSSGNAMIMVTPQGDNSIVVSPGANGLLSVADIDAHIDLIRNAGVVLSQLEVPMETVVHLASVCKREGVPLILDPAPAAPLSAEVLSAVTWLTPNETEAGFYTPGISGKTGDAEKNTIQSLFEQGVEGVVLKMGKRGSRIANRSGLDQSVQAIVVEAIDSTAAGDCFNGAFATALMRGKSPVESAQFASAAAAISVTRRGAQSSMPTLEEVEQLLSQQS